MHDLLINPRSLAYIENFAKNPTHAILLTGLSGVGLGTIAKDLAQKMAGANTFFATSNDKGKIAVEQIRNLYDLARGKQAVKFVIVIDDADTMTTAAQNAFLKLLEEPAANIYFILTAHGRDVLLPTIHSRVQEIEVLPAKIPDEFFADTKIAPNKLSQMLFIATGRPAEIRRMMESDDYFRERARINETAKKFIGANTYDRLIIVGGKKNRDEASDFVTALANLLMFMMARADTPNLTQNLELASAALDRLLQNGNVRAQMTFLATNMI